MQLVQQFSHNFICNGPLDSFFILALFTVLCLLFWLSALFHRTPTTPRGLLQFLSEIVYSHFKVKALRQTVVILCIWACVQALSYQQLSDCCFHIHATDTQKLLSWEDKNAEDCKTTDRCLASHAVALDRRDWNKRHKFKSKKQKTKAMKRTAN